MNQTQTSWQYKILMTVRVINNLLLNIAFAGYTLRVSKQYINMHE